MTLLYHEAGAVDIPIRLRPDARVKIGMVLRACALAALVG
jgi:hypothetical protein